MYHHPYPITHVPHPRWLGTYHSDTLTAHTELIEVLQDLGRVGDAQREADAVIAACAMLHGPSAPDTLRARVLRGAALLTGDDLEGAEEELRGVLGECEGALGASHGVTVRCREALGRVRDAWQQAGEAYLRDRNERLVGLQSCSYLFCYVGCRCELSVWRICVCL